MKTVRHSDPFPLQQEYLNFPVPLVSLCCVLFRLKYHLNL
jgi:hypothetical protein